MAQIDDVYSYLLENYGRNEPIFLAELNIPGMKPVSLRQQIKKLTEEGRLKRFDTGIYYLPQNSMFGFGSMLSPYDVIRKKYLIDGDDRCGYMSGLMFANQMGFYHSTDRVAFRSRKIDPAIVDGRWQPYGEERTVVLKRMKNPIALYTSRGEEYHRYPRFDEWVGFDLQVQLVG